MDILIFWEPWPLLCGWLSGDACSSSTSCFILMICRHTWGLCSAAAVCYLCPLTVHFLKSASSISLRFEPTHCHALLLPRALSSNLASRFVTLVIRVYIRWWKWMKCGSFRGSTELRNVCCACACAASALCVFVWFSISPRKIHETSSTWRL